MKLLTFAKESQGSEVVQSDIPAELEAEAELWRGQMLDQLFDYSNELGELLLAEEAVPEDRSSPGDSLGHDSQHGGAGVVRLALDHAGVQPVLDAVSHPAQSG